MSVMIIITPQKLAIWLDHSVCLSFASAVYSYCVCVLCVMCLHLEFRIDMKLRQNVATDAKSTSREMCCFRWSDKIKFKWRKASECAKVPRRCRCTHTKKEEIMAQRPAAISGKIEYIYKMHSLWACAVWCGVWCVPVPWTQHLPIYANFNDPTTYLRAGRKMCNNMEGRRSRQFYLHISQRQ